MCWTGNTTAIKKIAERDFYVYKIGRVPLDSIFVSHLKNFDYIPKNRNRKIPLIVQYPYKDICVVQQGYHSYKWIAFDDTNPRERCLYLGNYDNALKENLSLYGGYCCIATFIVPKGAEYFENKYGHIVSSEIIYTGKYLRISNFNK